MPKVFKDYLNGSLLRFLEHDGKLYIDTDDIVKMLESHTVH